jgi:RraA family protein
MTLGFRIHVRQSKVDTATVERFKQLPVANVSDAMSRMNAGGTRLRPYHAQGTVLAGPALTVKTRPGDNLMVYKAIDLAQEGDVIVIDAGGDVTNAIMGEIMTYMAQAQKVAGFVINGAIRDADEIRACGIAMYAAGVTHRGPYRDGPGEINVPVAIDGMVVHPGDLVLGDGDGVLSVPKQDVSDVLAAAQAKQAVEEQQIADIRGGNAGVGWLENLLKERGCEYVD